MLSTEFWRGKRVFLTGHTGFKGSWLALWLVRMGAQVTGYALAPPTNPSLFAAARIAERIHHQEADIRDLAALTDAVRRARPEIVIHLAAQALVRLSYQQPVETYETNVMGTVNLLETVRRVGGVRAVICVTSDKCYENREWEWGYRENDPMGGDDPYSNSKGCAELIITSYRTSFFPPERRAQHGVALASVRAGNVIGGGDWALDRLIPDIVRAVTTNSRPLIRHPRAIRPWQHVLDPLSGYLALAEQLYADSGHSYADGWNFGPIDEDAKPVAWICDHLCELWGGGAGWDLDQGHPPHEATYLKLDISRARQLLGWAPTWRLHDALNEIVSFNRAWQAGEDLRTVVLRHIERFEERLFAGKPDSMDGLTIGEHLQ